MRIYQGKHSEALNEFVKTVTLPEDSLTSRQGKSSLKPSAIPVLSLQNDDWVTLIIENKGNGKSAFVNMSNTWKWIMSAETGDITYRIFWGRLLSWMSSSQSPQLELSPQHHVYNVNDEQHFSIMVKQADMRPASDARITAELMNKDGASLPLHFSENAQVPGRFDCHFVQPDAGEFELSIKATLKNKKVLHASKDVLFVNRAVESEPAPLNQGALQTLSRLTEGAYWHYTDLSEADAIPVLSQKQTTEKKYPWLNSWITLILCLLVLFPDWYFRRRVGLR